MSELALRILDIVEVTDEPGLLGVITRIPKYPGGRIRYSVYPLTIDREDAVSLIYDEDRLRANGERAPISMFAIPGGFRKGDIVQVSPSYINDALAGRTAIIDGSFAPDGSIGIWVEELGEDFSINPQSVALIEETEPREFEPDEITSTSVNEAGVITGYNKYVVLDEIGRYI